MKQKIQTSPVVPEAKWYHLGLIILVFALFIMSESIVNWATNNVALPFKASTMLSFIGYIGYGGALSLICAGVVIYIRANKKTNILLKVICLFIAAIALFYFYTPAIKLAEQIEALP